MKIPYDPKLRRLLVVCALILLNLVVNWSFPHLKIIITRAVAALAWNYADNKQSDSHNSFFSNEQFRFNGVVHEEREENGVKILRYVFSNAAIDLTDSSMLPDRIELQSAFSNVSVRLPVDASITVHASGAFCSISLPGRQNVIFGENTVHCGTQDPNAPRLHIDLSCAFGAASFKLG